MSDRDDDLDAWRDDPLVRALRAPGTASELAGEKEMVAAYRRGMPVRSLRRVVGRLGVGGTAVVASVALSSGVAAAAYTRTLPEPVQRIAHNVFGPVGVPAAPVAEPKVRIKVRPPVSTPAPTRTPTPTSTPAPSPSPKATGKEPTRSGQPTAEASALTPVLPPLTPTGTPTPTPASSPTPTPSATPSPTPTTSPTPSPTPTPTPTATPTGPVVARVTLVPGYSSVVVGSSVTVSGDVTDTNGSAVRGRKVRLVTRLPGEPTWTRVDDGLTARDGSITLTTPGLAQNTIVQLRVGTVRSAGFKVVVVPIVSASLSDNAISVSATGALPGDLVALLRWRDGVLVQLSRVPLDADGTTSFSVDPPGERTARYVVRLVKTRQHAAAKANVTVPKTAS